MPDNICIFEDTKYENFLPLTYLRPVYELRCGILMLLEKIKIHFPKSNLILHTRKELEILTKQKYPKASINNFSGSALFVNGRTILDKNILQLIQGQKENFLLINNDNIIAFHLSKEKLKLIKDFQGCPFESSALLKQLKPNIKVIETSLEIPEYIWDIIAVNGQEIIKDFKMLKKTKKSFLKANKHIYTYKKENIFIDKDTEIDAQVVLDARKGPIYIGKNVKIFPHSCIEGPASIGDGCVIAGARFRENSSLGPVCKVGGEIEGVIFQGYSNKVHEGFLGHSYLGEWINLGALTTNSDLKNNYSLVKVQIGPKKIETGQQFLGSIIGDHTKTAIGTTLNTGTIIGIFCNIVTKAFPPKFINSFSWVSNEVTQYDLSKAKQTAKIVMGRRKIEFDKAYEDLIDYTFKKLSGIS